MCGVLGISLGFCRGNAAELRVIKDDRKEHCCSKGDPCQERSLKRYFMSACLNTEQAIPYIHSFHSVTCLFVLFGKILNNNTV